MAEKQVAVKLSEPADTVEAENSTEEVDIDSPIVSPRVTSGNRFEAKGLAAWTSHITGANAVVVKTLVVVVDLPL